MRRIFSVILITVVVALSSVGMAVAATVTDITSYADVLYLQPVETSAGSQVVVSLQMKNAIECRGFQCDLYLPDGVTFALDEDDFPIAALSTERTTAKKTDYFNAVIQADGALRLLCNSTNGYSFAGNSGEVAKITLNVSSSIPVGAYNLKLSKIKLSDPNAVDHVVKDVIYSSFVVKGQSAEEGTIDATDISAYEDIIYIESFEAVPGNQIEVSVQMKNQTEFRGFQFDLYLPEGVSFALDEDGFPIAELSTERTTVKKTDYFNSVVQKDGALRILCNSTNGYSFSGKEGEVATITLNISESIAEGSHLLTLANIKMSDPQAVDHVIKENVLCEFTIGSANPPTYDEGYALTIENVIVTDEDEPEANLMMDNMVAGEIRMVDFDLYLPEGVSLLQEDGEYVVNGGSRFASSTIRNQFRYDVEDIANGGLRISLYFGRTTASYVFSGTSGMIASLPLVIDAGVTSGTYSIALKNIVFNGDEYQVAPSTAILQIGSSAALGDANADGSVDVGDILAIQSHLNGRTPAGFNPTAADADQSTVVNKNDIITIRKAILQGE